MNLLDDLYSDAELSPDGVYRYRLRRAVGSEVLDGQRATTLLWVMLNPSTADARADDPTIRKVVGFTRREGFTQAEVVNLYGFRATEPDEMYAAEARGVDVVGPLNDAALGGALAAADAVVLAWGASPQSARRRASYARRVDVVAKILAALGGLGPRARCLGRTAAGDPRHPLFVRSAAILEPWGPR